MQPRLAMWTLSPLSGFVERRRAQRRKGIGRRTHGERRVLSTPAPATLPEGWPPRNGERRLHKRRTLGDRRSTAASESPPSSSPLP